MLGDTRILKLDKHLREGIALRRDTDRRGTEVIIGITKYWLSCSRRAIFWRPSDSSINRVEEMAPHATKTREAFSWPVALGRRRSWKSILVVSPTSVRRST